MLAAFFKALIRGYSYLISPLLGPNCRFHPTCSAYAGEAIDRHGAAKGGFLTLKRLLKCHPFHRADWHDPVPPAIAWAELFGYKRRYSRTCHDPSAFRADQTEEKR